MLSLFSTSSDTAGFRLQYMEVYNWGTFDEHIFRIAPEGNNSLLTGANGSGKTTFIDALLTLLVPLKRDRFYNQSSGVEKKGDRNEESYVLGHYGDIQKEGELSTTTQKLRDKNSYSVLLASFSNTDKKVITIFQVRHFSNGILKRTFGIAHKELGIQTDFSNFDAKGLWKKRLDKTHNSNTTKRRIEYFDSPNKYAERMSSLLGMRSTKALSLFNKVVGIKVLGDLDEFIKSNMLEDRDSENEYRQLKESFLTLINAKNNIDKAIEQINQLQPINLIANQLSDNEKKLDKLQSNKEKAVYWFAKKGKELAEIEKERLDILLKSKVDEINKLKTSEDELRDKESDLLVQIKSDKIGNQISVLVKEIKALESKRILRSNKLKDYNKLAEKLDFTINPNTETFLESRNLAKVNKANCLVDSEELSETLRLAKNKGDEIIKSIDDAIEDIKSLQKNGNNISGRESQIREEIIKEVGATKEEIPFIGELIKVDDMEWESSIEKVLHNFALRLIVPEKYYYQVNKYVNGTNLKGRIIYERFKDYTSLKAMQYQSINDDDLINKISFKKNNIYSEWIEESVLNQFNYICAKDLSTFNSLEKALTKEGLIKRKGRHEKDDRKHILDRKNYVLGWDNKEKINWWKKEIKKLQENEKLSVNEIRRIGNEIKSINKLQENLSDFFKLFTKFDEIDWKTYANEIQANEELKSKLEETNNVVKELQRQLEIVQKDLKNNEADKDIKKESKSNIKRDIDSVAEFNETQKDLLLKFGKNIPDLFGFEENKTTLIEISYMVFAKVQKSFQEENKELIDNLKELLTSLISEVVPRISAFKNPSEEISKKYKSWRSDVSQLPTNIEFISEYKKRYNTLKEEDLPSFKTKFNKYLEETILNKVTDFKFFFDKWSDDIKLNIESLNDALSGIDFESYPKTTYIRLDAKSKVNENVKEFRDLLHKSIPNYKELATSIDADRIHFENNIEPFIKKLEDEEWRKKIMDVRAWFEYKAEEINRENNKVEKTYSGMGQLSGGEKAQLTYTILGSAIAYQFGLTKEGLQSDSFRFIAIDEAFKAQDETKSNFLMDLCEQLHLQILVVTPNEKTHIVEPYISFVHYVERNADNTSFLYDMPIEQFLEEKEKYVEV